MATEFRQIKIRRGTGSIPSDVAQGELLLKTDTDGIAANKVFIGTATGTAKAIANLPDMGVTVAAAKLNHTSDVTSPIQAQLNLKAPLANPTFTGAVTVPTPSADPHAVTKAYSDLKAPLASPALTGTPTAPTATTGTDTTQIATTAFVQGAVASVNSGVSGVTASAAEINKLDGLTTSKTELGFLVGVTNPIQTQLNAKVVPADLEWQLEGTQSGEVLSSGFNIIIDDISWDFANYDYKVVFDFETTSEDNDQPYMRFNGLDNTSTAYNYLTKKTSSENDTVTVASIENTSLIRFGAALPSASTTVGMTSYTGEFIIRRSINTVATNNNYNFYVRGFASVTAISAPAAGFTGYPVESIFVGNFTLNTNTAFSSIDIYPGISAGSTDYAKARIYKRAK